MEILLLIGGILGGGAIAWWMAQSHTQSKAQSTIRGLESQVRFERGESAKVKEKLVLARGELTALQRTFDQERLQHSEKLTELGHSFKKGVLVLGVAYFAVGMTLGGVGAWFTASFQADARHAKENTELIIRANAAEDQSVFYKTQVQGLSAEVKKLQRRVHEGDVEKEVLKTKLHILLESLSPIKGIEGFTLNYDKLKKNLKKRSGETDLKAEIPLLQMRSL